MWTRRDKNYLITNWHVVTLRNNETLKHLHEKSAIPDSLVGHFRARLGSFETQQQQIPLLDADGRPLWLHHAGHGRAVDVVAIPLPDNLSEFVTPLNRLPHEPMLMQIGMDVYVLGFPFGSGAPSLPVWKRGSIASEPAIVRQAALHHLVDTASRPGMSGAPVILRAYGARLTEAGTSIRDEPGTRFFGVYSGRLHVQENEAQLARVWPESFIEEIIDGNVRDPGGW